MGKETSRYACIDPALHIPFGGICSIAPGNKVSQWPIWRKMLWRIKLRCNFLFVRWIPSFPPHNSHLHPPTIRILVCDEADTLHSPMFSSNGFSIVFCWERERVFGLWQTLLISMEFSFGFSLLKKMQERSFTNWARGKKRKEKKGKKRSVTSCRETGFHCCN